jgi:cellulose synthase/poly-beta-1,6-N-acetylglucosamine synthase-like glycosyltransferase
MIRDCVRAAASQDYPAHRYRVYLLDDAKAPGLEDAVLSLNSVGCKVTYLSRDKIDGVPHFYKAGNLRYGIEQTVQLGWKSEYIASLDVDAIADPSWLRKALPHLLLDTNLALINVAGNHYNAPSPDLLEQCSASAGDWGESLCDLIGTSTCYGSGYILRRSALEAIGGWPQVAVGEDIMCGFLLAGSGRFAVGSCCDVLQHDLTPASIEGVITQRQRWVSQ